MCRGQGADFAYGPADATASLAPVNPDWFYLGFTKIQEGRKMGVCVCVLATFRQLN